MAHSFWGFQMAYNEKFYAVTDCGQGSLDEPPLAQWLCYSWYFPRPLQIHFGVPRVLQGVCNLWSILLPHTASTHEEGPYNGGFPGAVRSSVQTHTGEVELSSRVFALSILILINSRIVGFVLVVNLSVILGSCYHYVFLLPCSIEWWSLNWVQWQTCVAPCPNSVVSLQKMLELHTFIPLN